MKNTGKKNNTHVPDMAEEIAKTYAMYNQTRANLMLNESVLEQELLRIRKEQDEFTEARGRKSLILVRQEKMVMNGLQEIHQAIHELRNKVRELERKAATNREENDETTNDGN